MTTPETTPVVSSWQHLDSKPLRFLTCGSVDSGKSTLIGRLLYDCKFIPDDQLRALARESRIHGSAGDDLELALLLDGLEGEREQHITIDVSHRHFATARRSFLIADTPGHEQYTRNMATGASGCDLAVIVTDTQTGIVSQTRRHSAICSLFGIRHVVLVINKMDLIGFDRAQFDSLAAEYRAFASNLEFTSIVVLPIVARHGDNVSSRSSKMPWYQGPTFLDYLETIDIDQDVGARPFRFPVQLVNRPNSDFRGYSGTITSGILRSGDVVKVVDSQLSTRVKRIVTPDGDLQKASTGDAVTLVLEDNVDVSRGDLLTGSEGCPELGDQFAANVLCLAENPLLPGRTYMMRVATRWIPASITTIKYRLDVQDLAPHAAAKLSLNEIGCCNLMTMKPFPIDDFAKFRDTGSFILVDRYTNQTLGVGMIKFPLRRSANVHPERLAIDKRTRAEAKGQIPLVLWFTGLPGAGKSTTGKLVEQHLNALGFHTYMLDGDNVRHGLNRDLGFTDTDRVENIRRVGEVAKMFLDAGLVVICTFISPFRAERQMVRDLFEPGEFLEIFVDTPLEECMMRDTKSLFAKARSGTLKNLTGYDSPYERPEKPDLVLLTTLENPEQLAQRVVALVRDQIRWSGTSKVNED